MASSRAGHSGNEFVSNELYSLSFDSVEEDLDCQPWRSLIQNLSYDQLQRLKNIFNTTDLDQRLNKEQFLDAIAYLYNNSKYSLQSLLLFDAIKKVDQIKISWTDLIDYLSVNLIVEPPSAVTLIEGPEIVAASHTKRETIVKIVLIETEKYFCYVMLSKHGKVGLYDGNLNFLISYQVIMTREDINRKEEERRRRNRWITDAVFCRDILMFIITNTARSIVIYDASGLKHVPMFLILSTPNIVQSLAYKCCQQIVSVGERKYTTSILYMGDNLGVVSSFVFHQPMVGLFRKKHNDKISLFYWGELPEEKDFVTYKQIGNFHKEAIRQLKYCSENGTLISCSRDPQASVLVKYMENQKSKSFVFSMNKGATCCAHSIFHKILITGSDDGVLRLWNSIVTANPVASLNGHDTGIVDVQIMENQHVFLSISREGTLKLWNIKEHKCIQILRIKFPSFKVHGKLIEWGINCIYPGAKRDLIFPSNDETFQFVEEFDESSASQKALDTWERSHILVPCCNFIAKVRLSFGESQIESSFESKVLPPPPLQNSVLIPTSWKIDERIHFEKKEVDAEDPEAIAKHMEELKFILERELGEKSDINLKIAMLEKKKVQMQKHVARGAPYMALDLYEIEEVKLRSDLPVPNKKRTKNLVGNLGRILEDASARDLILSDPSSSTRSPRSSRSSIVEFQY